MDNVVRMSIISGAALDLSPSIVSIHFTIANIYSSMVSNRLCVLVFLPSFLFIDDYNTRIPPLGYHSCINYTYSPSLLYSPFLSIIFTYPFPFQGDFERALNFYYSTIALQSTFEPAKERVRAIYCFHEGEKYNRHVLI